MIPAEFENVHDLAYGRVLPSETNLKLRAARTL